MKRLLYPLIATALVTIVPFLLTFEKGQDIIRGLFDYEVFALLLLFIFVRGKLKEIPAHTGTNVFFRVLLIVLPIMLFFVAWTDLQNILAIKNWTLGWYGILPFFTCAIAFAMVWGIKPFQFNTICCILFFFLILHLEANNRYPAQPLAQFPTIDYLERIAPKPVQRKEISEDFRKKYPVIDSVAITRDYVDTTRNNVVILVESWGVPLDIQRFEKQLSTFDGIKMVVGAHNRMYSRTRTAEREDLMYEIHRDSTGRDTIFLPKLFGDIGYETAFLYGGDSLEHFRFKYIHNIGFNHTVYANGADDATIIFKIDSILADSMRKHFIAWTTSDTKFPMKDFSDIYYSNANAVDSSYTMRLEQSLALVANLARKYPDTRFIVQGDHNPILAPVEFQERFYKRWVPFVVLN